MITLIILVLLFRLLTRPMFYTPWYFYRPRMMYRPMYMRHMRRW